MLMLEAGWVGILLLGDLGESVPVFFGLYAITFLGYLLGIRSLESISFPAVVAFGLLFRLTVLAIAPSLSDDIYRYLWDGLVQLQGINPYLFAPNASELAHVAGPGILDRVNHSELHTIYPPFAQYFFMLCAWVSGNVMSIKVGVLLWDCVTLVFLAGLARSYDIPPSAVAFYFWNPLVILEGVGHGHVDIVAVSLLVVALLYLRIGGYGRAGAALALSGLAKLLPILLLPAFWRWAGRSEADQKSILSAMFSSRALVLPLSFCFVFVLGYLPFADAGWGVFGSLSTYASSWEFNAPVYGLLRYLGLDGSTARLVLSFGLAVATLAVSVRPIPAIQAAYYFLGVFVVLTPTLHPWYLIWMLPFLCFYGNRGWITMSGTIVLAYQVLIQYRETGVWEDSAWVSWAIFLVSGAVWAWPVLKSKLQTKTGELPSGNPPASTSTS